MSESTAPLHMSDNLELGKLDVELMSCDSEVEEHLGESAVAKFDFLFQ